MNVFIRPTGAPLGVGLTLGFAPNGSAASLDTAPVETEFAGGDMLLIQRAGALQKVQLAGSVPVVFVTSLSASGSTIAVGWSDGTTTTLTV
jgi:hypothetical protein